MSTPREDGCRLLPDWVPHERTWMAWPSNEAIWGPELDEAKLTVAAVATAIARFEPVTMLARPEAIAEASLRCGTGVTVMPMAMDDCWIRDTGPLFLDGGPKGLAATSFRFNGWGNRRTPYAADQKLAERLLAHQNLPAYVADLVFEGGSIETDGEGTLLVTTPTLLDQRRNPGITMAAAEAALRDWLGIERVIWLPHGLLEDEGGGQVENVARFAAPGIVLTLTAQDANDANAEGLLANQAALAEAVDAKGRHLEVHTLPLVRPRHAPDGRRLAVSHLSYALTNGGLIMPQFAGPSDATSRKALAAAFPGREIVEQDALTIALGGGSIHGITLPQPAAAKAGD